MKIKYIVKYLLLWAFVLGGESVFAQQPLTGNLTVNKDEKKEIPAGSSISELVIYGDNASVGQITVSGGVIQIDKLIYKYSFTPGQWGFISFPVDVNIKTMSNLDALGVTYAFKRFNTTKASQKAEPWEKVTTLLGLQGYSIYIEPTQENNPVEVTFSLDNLNMDTESSKRMLFLSLDMTNEEPGKSQTLYVNAKNIKSNVLKLDVSYSPENTSALPMNYEMALKDARIIPTTDKKGVRLSLPDSEPAKVLILNKKGDKILKKILYAAPGVIDVSDLRKRSYQMIIQYGTATVVKEFQK